MKTLFKKTSTIALLIASITISLVGCGTGADSGGMGKSSSTVSPIK